MLRGGLPMDADECRRMARHYFAIAQQMSVPDDRALMMVFAAYWTGKPRRPNSNLSSSSKFSPRKNPRSRPDPEQAHRCGPHADRRPRSSFGVRLAPHAHVTERAGAAEH